MFAYFYTTRLQNLVHLRHSYALRTLFQKAFAQPIQNILQTEFRRHQLRQIGVYRLEVDIALYAPPSAY